VKLHELVVEQMGENLGIWKWLQEFLKQQEHMVGQFWDADDEVALLIWDRHREFYIT